MQFSARVGSAGLLLAVGFLAAVAYVQSAADDSSAAFVAHPLGGATLGVLKQQASAAPETPAPKAPADRRQGSALASVASLALLCVAARAVSSVRRSRAARRATIETDNVGRLKPHGMFPGIHRRQQYKLKRYRRGTVPKYNGTTSVDKNRKITSDSDPNHRGVAGYYKSMLVGANSFADKQRLEEMKEEFQNVSRLTDLANEDAIYGGGPSARSSKIYDDNWINKHQDGIVMRRNGFAALNWNHGGAGGDNAKKAQKWWLMDPTRHNRLHLGQLDVSEPKVENEFPQAMLMFDTYDYNKCEPFELKPELFTKVGTCKLKGARFTEEFEEPADEPRVAEASEDIPKYIAGRPGARCLREPAYEQPPREREEFKRWRARKENLALTAEKVGAKAKVIIDRDALYELCDWMSGTWVTRMKVLYESEQHRPMDICKIVKTDSGITIENLFCEEEMFAGWKPANNIYPFKMAEVLTGPHKPSLTRYLRGEEARVFDDFGREVVPNDFRAKEHTDEFFDFKKIDMGGLDVAIRVPVDAQVGGKPYEFFATARKKTYKLKAFDLYLKMALGQTYESVLGLYKEITSEVAEFKEFNLDLIKKKIPEADASVAKRMGKMAEFLKQVVAAVESKDAKEFVLQYQSPRLYLGEYKGVDPPPEPEQESEDVPEVELMDL